MEERHGQEVSEITENGQKAMDQLARRDDREWKTGYGQQVRGDKREWKKGYGQQGDEIIESGKQGSMDSS